MLLRGHERNFFECDHLLIEVRLKLFTVNNGNLEANIAIGKMR